MAQEAHVIPSTSKMAHVSLCSCACAGGAAGTVSGVAWYPIASTFCTIVSTSVWVGSYVTMACSVARLTLASWTPGIFFSPFSIRMAQEAHVMPSRAKVALQVPVSCISLLAVRLCMEYVAFVAIRFTFRFMYIPIPIRYGYIRIIV